MPTVPQARRRHIRRAWRAKAHPTDGFTLIELLIVLVILGILSAVVVFAIAAITDRGRGSACRSDRATIESASEAYFAKHHHYASSMDALVTAGLVRETPDPGQWTITYDPATGAVNAVGC